MSPSSEQLDTLLDYRPLELRSLIEQAPRRAAHDLHT